MLKKLIDNIKNIEENSMTYLTIESDEVDKIKKELNMKIIAETDNLVKFINTLKPNELLEILSKAPISKSSAIITPVTLYTL